MKTSGTESRNIAILWSKFAKERERHHSQKFPHSYPKEKRIYIENIIDKKNKFTHYCEGYIKQR